MKTLHAACLTCLMAAAPAFAQPGGALQQPSQPGTQWTEQQIREAVAPVRAGRRLTPKSWPNHARVAVCLSFDDDTEAPLLRDGAVPRATNKLAAMSPERPTPCRQ